MPPVRGRSRGRARWFLGLLLVLAPSAAAGASATWSVVEETPIEVDGRTWAIRTLEGRWRRPDAPDHVQRSDVWVYTPSTVKAPGVVVGLPGWKFAARTWEDKAAISAHADALGIAVALPEMHTTVYASAFFPETRADKKWCGPSCSVAGSPWMGEVVLPYLAASVGPVQGLFGLSTGGRGAVLLPQHYPGLGIPRVCSMSGTFDLFSLDPKTGEYRIHAVVYGERADHPGRWRADDSLVLVDRLRAVEVLLIHGSQDRDVPPQQSAVMAAALTRLNAAVGLVLVDDGGHDWTLWSAHLRQCLDFLVRAEE